MSRNKIYAVVEGHGEANKPSKGEQPAITVLIAKVLHSLNCYQLFPQSERTPIFRLSYGDFFRAESQKFENSIRYHNISYPDCAALLFLLDMDDDCAVERSGELTTRVKGMEKLPFSVSVVCAVREYEAWFLASLDTIHEDETYDGNPEEPRDPKGWLRRKFDYKQTQNQSEYTRKLDILTASNNSRSFRRLVHAFEEIIKADEDGTTIISPAYPKISIPSP